MNCEVKHRMKLLFPTSLYRIAGKVNDHYIWCAHAHTHAHTSARTILNKASSCNQLTSVINSVNFYPLGSHIKKVSLYNYLYALASCGLCGANAYTSLGSHLQLLLFIINFSHCFYVIGECTYTMYIYVDVFGLYDLWSC